MQATSSTHLFFSSLFVPHIGEQREGQRENPSLLSGTALPQE